ncbi:alpha-ribazole phosphatase [Ilyobacter polytropus]|uniref:Alpha-ribazole phosphatase n=1 Tax=Ilyobacter polytropus (strain ATCC 51220 / DSM 2926 / LMG 16218 / CuHBu1) TaxID=572544 RepID=E3H611_ILYPC|nr:alpha-ribazole phosphatase [Ilyobacter polytropus]ADO82301.1 Phosphoglycerate mutase [Ilyobacter polytropus DSM 2926]
MGKVILVRHGESEMNRDGLFFGWLDPKLTEKGIKQAHNAKSVIQSFEYDEIYSSDLSRARETADIVNYQGLPVKLSQELREINFGIFEGLTYKEIKEKYPDEVKLWREKWQEYDYENGENVTQLQRRAVEFLKSLDKEKKDIVVVTHWGVINCILSYYITGGLEGYWKFALDTGGVSILEFREGFPVLHGLNIGGK